MFQSEICKHPQIQTVAYSPHTYLETHHWLKGAVLTHAAPATFSGNKVYSGYGNYNSALQYTIDGIKGNVPDFQVPTDVKELVFKGWDALCEKFAKPVFFEKSPQYIANWASLSLMLEWAEQTSYCVKYIGLTRNPLSVQYSAFKLFFTEPEKRQFGWLENQKNLLAFQSLVPADSFYSVKYEDIISNPQDAFSGIFSFLGLSDYSIAGRGTHSKSLEKWRDDSEFQLQLDPAVKQIARKFGYSESELTNPKKPPLPKNYKRKKRMEARFKLFKTRLRDRVIIPLSLKRKNKQ